VIFERTAVLHVGDAKSDACRYERANDGQRQNPASYAVEPRHPEILRDDREGTDFSMGQSSIPQWWAIPVSIGRERWDLRVGLVQEDDFDRRAFPSPGCLARCFPLRVARLS
jgi:hypothetical protein